MTGRLAYFAFWFPPSRASGVYRAVESVRAFVDQGWDVTVFTVDRGYLTDVVGSVDETLVELVPPSVEVVRVRFPRTFGSVADVRAINRFAASFPTVAAKARSVVGRGRDRLRLGRRSVANGHGFEDPYVTWIDPLLHAVDEACGSGGRPFDLVLATGNPYSSFEAARRAAAAIGVPFIVDFRDPWTIDVFDGSRAAVGRGVEAVEANVMAEAAAAIHVNEPIAAAYRRRYPAHADKQHVVVNGFDRASLREVGSGPGGGPVRFGTLGTINARWPLDALIDGFALARPDLPAGSEFRLAGHLGYFDRSAADIEERFPDEGSGFRYVGPVPKSDVGVFYGSVDVVVVPAPGGSMVTSGKIFEAVAQGIPVVVVQADGGGARSIIEGRDAAFAAEPTPVAVAEALRAAAKVAATQTVDDQRGIRSAMERYERSVALRVLVDVAEGLRGG